MHNKRKLTKRMLCNNSFKWIFLKHIFPVISSFRFQKKFFFPFVEQRPPPFFLLHNLFFLLLNKKDT